MSNINLDLQASHKMLTLLDEANANTESVIDLIPGIFVVINDRHEVLRANAEFIRMVGLDQDASFKLPMENLFHSKNWEIFAHQVKKVIRGGGTAGAVKFELDMMAGGSDSLGRPFHWILTCMNARNKSEGQLVTVFGHDMSEMREAERRLVDIFTNIPLGIFTINRNGTVSNAYSSYLETMLDCDSLAGLHVNDVLFQSALTNMDNQAIRNIEAVTACMGKSDIEFGEYSKLFPQEFFRHSSGDVNNGRWLKVTYQPVIFNHIVEQLLIILEDQSAIVNADREMKKAAQEREQSLAVYESAIRDPLTGLYTRLYMKDAVVAMLDSHDSGAIDQASMVIFDIDHFKRINDTYGHQSGDIVLSRVAEVILRMSGENHIPIRFGGEEFIVFLPYDNKHAFELAEAIRKTVEQTAHDLGDSVIKVTISGGIAMHQCGESLENLIHRADLFLYAAKKNGRNRNIVETSQLYVE
ncbi:MAG: GGDEF domain-containing protein [Rhodoferax sp.]|nr:GGDEF domain-containing protein [Rhodoferax sp.]